MIITQSFDLRQKLSQLWRKTTLISEKSKNLERKLRVVKQKNKTVKSFRAIIVRVS